MSLKSKIVLRLLVSLILMVAMLFVPAGSLRFWQAWVLIGLVFIPVVSSYVYCYQHDPQLIERRLQSKEKVSEQRFLIRLLKSVFFAAFRPERDFQRPLQHGSSSYVFRQCGYVAHHTLSHGRGLGAGPSIFCPVRWKWLP